MRRLTLILSDLYLPGDIGSGEVPRVQELPALERWLRYADRPERISDWRRWLTQDLSAAPLAAWPVAHVHALAAGIDPRGVWLATPVRLEARLDHVRLADRGLLRLPCEQSLALSEEFNATFGPEHRLTRGDAHSLLLEGGPDQDLQTVDPARLLDADIAPAIASGPSATALRRLVAEIEMWLPATRANVARERAGLRTITALWLWGGGKSVGPMDRVTTDDREVRLRGGDSYLSALAALVAKGAVLPAPASLGELGEFSRAYVELAPMSGPASESLTALDANWFKPAFEELRTGRLDVLTLVTNDRVYRATRRATLKFWRRRHHWLAALKA